MGNACYNLILSEFSPAVGCYCCGEKYKITVAGRALIARRKVFGLERNTGKIKSVSVIC